MAAIMGLDDERVIAACAEAAQGQSVEAVNFNAPNQVVIAGHKEAVERAITAAKALGAKRGLLLPVSAPFHSRLLQPAADKLKTYLEGVSVGPANVAVLHNVDVSARRRSRRDSRGARAAGSESRSLGADHRGIRRAGRDAHRRVRTRHGPHRARPAHRAGPSGSAAQRRKRVCGCARRDRRARRSDARRQYCIGDRRDARHRQGHRRRLWRATVRRWLARRRPKKARQASAHTLHPAGRKGQGMKLDVTDPSRGRRSPSRISSRTWAM